MLVESDKNPTGSPINEDLVKIMVCAGTGCKSSGSLEIYNELKNRIEDLAGDVKIGLLGDDGYENLDEVEVEISGCHGFCDEGPLVRIDPMGILYTNVELDDVEHIVSDTVQNGKLAEDLCYRTSEGDVYPKEEEIPFYQGQQRLVLGNCGKIDPESIESYEETEGYRALEKVLTSMSPEEVWTEVLDSNLRGRGGAGFPTGRKWQFACEEEADQKYVIANCDEGDPGAFMDRSLTEGDPHRIIEGLTTAGYATGASQGFIYVRAEYPLAVKRINKAIEDAYEAGYLGENIFDSGFSFDMEVKRGAGAFVCGEETALISSLEGEAGRPHPRPPYPAHSGLYDKPTTINNVETLGNVPMIIRNGADWFRNIGNENSPGTKTFAITGDVKNTGLIEVPMGLSLREIIYDVAGGIQGDKEFKAVQIGGPSGGCLPDKHLDIPLDFDSLQEVGAMVGSGGLVVMDEDSCMVDVAKFFLDFIQDESCGKCTPCRDGTKRMLELLEKLTAGEGEEGDIAKLEELSNYIKEASICGLGQTAPNPVLSTLDYFRDEYQAHLANECPAEVCFD
ncbi:MAG: NADH-quinone oxidoreductase subunit NuoF [Candidatus Bipolaricaulota bacterium]|nr:NADH-quinone oxidoreductase subunit NuoF [Candidatus Bipolaricaulota bacterium]